MKAILHEKLENGIKFLMIPKPCTNSILKPI